MTRSIPRMKWLTRTLLTIERAVNRATGKIKEATVVWIHNIIQFIDARAPTWVRQWAASKNRYLNLKRKYKNRPTSTLERQEWKSRRNSSITKAAISQKLSSSSARTVRNQGPGIDWIHQACRRKTLRRATSISTQLSRGYWPLKSMFNPPIWKSTPNFPFQHLAFKRWKNWRIKYWIKRIRSWRAFLAS